MVVSLVGLDLVGSSLQAAQPHDRLTLPGPTFPDVTQHLSADAPDATLQRLDEAQGSMMRPLEGLVLRATALDAAGRGDEAETHWNEIIARAADTMRPSSLSRD